MIRKLWIPILFAELAIGWYALAYSAWRTEWFPPFVSLHFMVATWVLLKLVERRVHEMRRILEQDERVVATMVSFATHIREQIQNHGSFSIPTMQEPSQN